MKTYNLNKIINCLKSVCGTSDRVVEIKKSHDNTQFIVKSYNCYGSFKVPETNKTEKSALLDIDALSKIVSTCNEDEIDIDITDKSAVVKYGKARYNLTKVDQSLPNVVFPSGDYFPLHSRTLSEAFAPLAAFCDPASAFDSLKGVYLADDYCFFASNQRIMIIRKNPLSKKLFIYFNFVNFLSQLDQLLEVSISEKFISVRADEFLFYFDIRSQEKLLDITPFIALKPLSTGIYPLATLKNIASASSIVKAESIHAYNDEDGFKLVCLGQNNSFDLVLGSHIEKFDKKIIINDTESFREAIKSMSMIPNSKEEKVKFEIFDSPPTDCVGLSMGEFDQILPVKFE